MFIKSKKGQTAMEYLMTYGWAILAVLVIGGVLYYLGIFSPGTLVGESKTGFSQVDVDQWAIQGGDNISMVVMNRAGETVNIETIYITADGSTESTDIGETVNTGQKTTLTTPAGLPNSYAQGEAYRLDVSIQFNYSSSGLVKNSSGRLTGTV